MDSTDTDDHVQRVNRFKHQSYNQTLKDVHLPSALTQSEYIHEIGDNDSHFHATLEHWRQLNLAPGFLRFAAQVDPLSASMPLLLHNWREIVEKWISALESSSDDALRPLLDLLQKIAHDLRTTLSPIYPTLLTHLLALLPRSISAPALTALLATLAALFKYLLVPSIHLDLLQETWASLRAVLPGCLPEVQRAVAEVWGSVLRRLKSTAREKAVVMMAEGVEGVEDATAWMFVFACKSVSQTLHTATPSIITPLLAYHISPSPNPNSEGSYTLIRRVLTAFIHHVKNADQFSGVAEILVKEFCKIVDAYAASSPSPSPSETEIETERLRRILEVVAVPCAVRHGSRLTQSHLTSLLGQFSRLPLSHTPLHPALLGFTAAALMAGDVGLWMGVGRGVVERVWTIEDAEGGVGSEGRKEKVLFAVQLSGVLAELGWGGWKMVGLSWVLKITPGLLEKESGDGEKRKVLGLLAALHREKKLGDVDFVWRRKVEGWAAGRLRRWTIDGQDEDSAKELVDILTLSTAYFSSGVISPLVIGIIEGILRSPSVNTQPPEANGSLNSTSISDATNASNESTPLNATPAWVLGTCMQALAKMDPEGWAGVIDLGRWVRGCLRLGGQSGEGVGEEVLGGLVALLNAHANTSSVVGGAVGADKEPAVSLEEVYPVLRSSILSHSHGVRLGALRLLVLLAHSSAGTASTAPTSAPDDTTTSGSMLVSRSPSLIRPSKRETNKPPQASAPQPHSAHDVLKRCLQGEEVSLDVQGVRERVLRIGRVGSVVGNGSDAADVCVRWLIAQLQVNLRPLWSPAAGALASLSQRFGDLVWGLLFEELKGVQLISREGMSSDANGENDVNDDDANDPWEDERTWRDPSAHKVRSVITKWVDEKAGGVFKTHSSQDRFDHKTYEFQLLSTLTECSSLAEKHNRELVPFFLSLTNPQATADAEAAPKLSRQKLSAWLTLFSKFTNPRACHSTETLHALYTSLLSHPDRSMQTLALTCLLTYKSPRLTRYEDKIKVLLDDTRWRDELISLDLGGIGNGGEEEGEGERGEVVGVVMRLLFGLMLEKKGRSRGADRRAAVLGTLGGCTDGELGLLVDLMLGPVGSDKDARGGQQGTREELFSVLCVPDGTTEKQQIGFLTLLGDVLKNLGPRLVSYWPALLGTTVDLIGGAQAKVGSGSRVEGQDEAEVEVDGDGEDGDAEDMDEGALVTSSSKATRSVRQLGLKRFADFFRCPVTFDFAPFMKESFTSFISPRLASLDKENTQAPSALLELFYAWTLQGDHVMYLVEYDSRVLPKVYDCLVATNVKPAVISRIFDIVDRLLAFSTVDEAICEKVVKPHVSLLLKNLATLVERTKDVAAISTPLGQRQIGILSEIAQYCTDTTQASTLLGLFSPLLRRPAKIVPEKVKVDLLKILGNLLQLIPDLSDRTSAVYIKTYGLLSQLFQNLRSRQSRLALVAAFHRLVLIGDSSHLQTLAGLLESLNAYSTKRIEEPDFDRRLEAFATLNETLYKSLSPQDWLPLIYNMLHFIQDPVELAVRNNASFTLRHFVDLVAAGDDSTSEYEATFMRTLLPGLKNGLRSKNEMVRSEVLGVLAYAVSKCTKISSLQEMQVLLAGGDDEANFFNNIHHVQLHRRSRALRRLADQCDEGHLRSNTLAEIFVPLVGNYITTTASLDHHLVNEAILTTGRMAKHLSWGAYYALVQKYLKVSRDKDESERVYVRTLVAILDNFHFPMEEVVSEVEKPQEGDVEVVEDHDELDEDPPAPTVPAPAPSSAKDLARIADAVNLRLLPNLLNHLEKRDVTTEDSTRIPIAIGIVKVAKHLPAATREPQISRLLTILSQVLRSRSQETRDLTRDTLARIAVTLGPSYLPSMLREMRGALLRGPQLHVLAHVTHALLVHVTTGEHAEAFEMLDECVNDVAYVSAEVVFGESGKDVQAEEFKTTMREVRSSSAKGLDSFGIMAKYITPPKISSLLVPLRSIMHETESIKVMNLVEEVLKRVAGGLNANKHLVPAELLVLCHTLISQNARFLKQAPTQRKGHAKGDAIVQMKRHTATDTDHYANNSFRFVAFGLDLFNTALRRNRFDFRDAAIIARLESMVVVVGNTLYSSSMPVLLLGLKSAASIVKCPLKSFDKSLPVFIRQIIDIVKQTGNTESEVVQVAFKSLATILRDGPAVHVNEKDLVYILELLSPDLEEPSRQASVFTMLRAIVSRKFIVPEFYDLMDKVSQIMVTSQAPQVQELCRGVLLQFLLDYPQGKGRLRNQMTFLAKNLSYVYESGRKSVMELLGAVIAKFQAALVQEYADLLFVALVMVIANDDSTKCREIAGQLIKTLLTRLDDTHRRTIMSHLHSWASQYEQPQLARVSSQVYGLIVDALQLDVLPYTTTILEDLNASLARSAQQLELIKEGDSMEVDVEWQVPYHALVVLSKVLRIFPDFTTQPEKVLWTPVVAHLLFPHAWVRTASCRLLGLLFTAVPPAAPKSELKDDSPLSRVGMQDIAKKLCMQLKSEHLDEALSLQVVKNLFYLGKCFYAIPLPVTQDDQNAEKEGDVEFDEEDGGDADENKQVNPLPWLFSKLSYQIKSAHIARRNRTFSTAKWSHQPLSALRWFAAMTSHMEASRIEKFLVHILTPVYRITDDDTIRDAQMEELKTLAVELQDLVQSKVGVTKFSSTYNQIRQGALGVRRERKAAKLMQATTNPEAAAKRKLQRNSIKKDSRKRKSQVFADGKGRVKRRREE